MNKLFPILLICLILSACKKAPSKKEDQQKLDLVFQQIKSMSAQVDCVNEADWRFVAYGAKACGGPTGYIAYSTKIDVPLFLDLIGQYHTYQEQYNEKWGIMSDCALTLAPKSVTCENGKPKLVF